MAYLTFPEFQATRRHVADLDTEIGADFGAPDGQPTSGDVYADACYIQDIIDNVTNEPSHMLVIERSTWESPDLEELEKILWAMHYLGEQGDVFLRPDDGTLDNFVQGVCAAYHVEVDGDLWGHVFSGVQTHISERVAFNLMRSHLDPDETPVDAARHRVAVQAADTLQAQNEQLRAENARLHAIIAKAKGNE